MRDFSIDLIWTKVQIAITALGGWLGYFLGGMDGLLIALLVFAVLDYITGIMCAIADRKLSSAVGFRGICRKVLIFALVGVGHILDTQVVGTGSALRSAVICWYLSNEGISILENAAHLGLPVPDKLRTVLEQLHDRKDKDDMTDQGDGESSSSPSPAFRATPWTACSMFGCSGKRAFISTLRKKTSIPAAHTPRCS